MGTEETLRCQSSPTEYEGGGGRGAIENWLPVHCQWGEDKTRVQSLMGDHVTFIVTQPNSFKPHPFFPPPPLILKAINKDHSLRGFIYNHVFFFFKWKCAANIQIITWYLRGMFTKLSRWHSGWEPCNDHNIPISHQSVSKLPGFDVRVLNSRDLNKVSGFAFTNTKPKKTNSLNNNLGMT